MGTRSYAGPENIETKYQSLPSRCYSLKGKHTGNYKAFMVSFVTQGVRGSHSASETTN